MPSQAKNAASLESEGTTKQEDVTLAPCTVSIAKVEKIREPACMRILGCLEGPGAWGLEGAFNPLVRVGIQHHVGSRATLAGDPGITAKNAGFLAGPWVALSLRWSLKQDSFARKCN